MNFLLKIVEGPNRGAEIALVEGVAVTLGKGDSCDVVLADSTLPDAPLTVAARADGVAIDGADLEPFHVRTAGATSFAVGPADAPWGALVWPAAEEDVGEAPSGGAEAPGGEPKAAEKAPASEGDRPQPDSGKGEEPAPAKRRRGCIGCLAALAVLLLLLAVCAWIFRDRLRENDRIAQLESIGRGWYARCTDKSRESIMAGESAKASLSDVAGKYGLSLAETNGAARLSGNLATRRERLAATAEAYEAKPGVELDLSDDESFRATAEDALFTLTEGALKVAAVTNRVLAVTGSCPSPLVLGKVVESLNADMPKLRGVDVMGVVISHGAAVPRGAESAGPATTAVRTRASKAAATSFPVCGILTSPYPCLVMRDGRRVLEGAALGDGVVVEIGADSVTVTNSTGRFTWKP